MINDRFEIETEKLPRRLKVGVSISIMICVIIVTFVYYLHSCVNQYDFKLTHGQYALLKRISHDENIPESIRDKIKGGDVSLNEYRDIIKIHYNKEKLEYNEKIVPMFTVMIAGGLAALFVVAATGGVPFVVFPIVMGTIIVLMLM